jgi:hypothetical protein
MKNLRKISLRLVAFLTAASIFALSAVLHAQSAALKSVKSEAIPKFGTFWSMQLGDDFPPMPFFPSGLGDFKVYYLGDGNQYMYDDLDFDYESYWTKLAEIIAEVGLDSFGGGGANSPLDYGTNDLWLEITAVTNDFAHLTLHNTVTNQTYVMLTKSDLTWSNWTGELLVTGAVANATAAQLATQARTNLFVWARTCSSSNLTVNSSPTKEQLVQLLLGTCVTISNVIYMGTNVARGTFTNGLCSGLPIDSGVILSSGNITNALGPNGDTGRRASTNGSSIMNTGGDADLVHLVGEGDTYDAAVLEFDIISSNFFVLRFQYFFASEEYSEWIGSPPDGYNDPMAIFVTTNHNGTIWINASSNNIALVPGTTNTPVSVNTINGGGVNHDSQIYIPPTNPQYYRSNDPPALNIQYDGLTVLLTAEAQISPGVLHHIKIAIADYGDDVYDSAVFLKAAPPCP